MKLILTADWHLRDDVPKSRTDRDTFFDEQFKKVEFIVNYAIEHDATIMLAGDVFHKSKVSPKVINRLAETIRNDVDILVIPGNHDLPNHNPELLEESSYGTMLHLGLLTFVVRRQ